MSNIHTAAVAMATTFLNQEPDVIIANDDLASIGYRAATSNLSEVVIVAYYASHGIVVTVCNMRTRIEIVGQNNALIVFTDGETMKMTRTEFMEQW